MKKASLIVTLIFGLWILVSCISNVTGPSQKYANMFILVSLFSLQYYSYKNPPKS